MEIIAMQKYVRMSPRKVRRVADSIRGIDNPMRVIEYLQFVGKRASLPIVKTFKQALANAKNNMKLGDVNLRVKEIQIGEGSRYKRFRAGSRGMAKPILKRTSHIRVILETIDKKGGNGGTESTPNRV